MSTASQQQNYTTGLNVTATILNTEFGNIITHLNSIYDFIDDSTGTAVITVDETNSYVGIGTDSPTTGLHINTGGITGLSAGAPVIKIEGAANNERISMKSYGASNAASFEGLGARGTVASPTATQADDVLVQLRGDGVDNAAAETGMQGSFSIRALENFTTTAQGTYALISVTPTSETTMDETLKITGLAGGLMVLEPSGAVMLLKGEFFPRTDNTYDLGSSIFRWDDVYATNGTIQTSDENDKELIEDASLGLDFVETLRPVKFKWKKTYKKDNKNQLKEEGEKRTHYGLIAQEVETALDGVDFAGLIKDSESGKYGLRYNDFIPVLIKAIQELKAEVDSLK